MRIVAGNWKMHKTRAEARSLVDALREALDASPELRDTKLPKAGFRVVVFPPFTCLAEVAARAGEQSRGLRPGGVEIEIGAQDVYPGREGAFTGEVSSRMLLDAGATVVLVGHSERRHVIGEGDALLGEKVRAGLEHGLRPLFCVGETLEERESEQMGSVLERQIDGALGGLGEEDLAQIWVAYEPVWAIGTGRTATPEQAEAAHRHLRQLLCERWPQQGPSCPLLYGGSVKPENTHGLISRAEVSGVLVGGASLDAVGFAAIASEAART